MSFVSRKARMLALVSAVSAVLASAPAFAADPAQDSPFRHYDPADGFIVGYRADAVGAADHAQRQRALDAAAANAFGRAQAPVLRQARRLATGGDLIRVDRRISHDEAERLMRAIAADPQVEYVEANIRMHTDFVPNDTYYYLQTNFHATGENTYAEQAWDRGYRGQGKIIAVIDTGITNHPDLNPNVLPGYDFVSDTFIANDGGGRDNNPADPGDWVAANQCYVGSPASNSSWHGTHVAGIAAAATNNSTGVAGMAFSARILPVRVLGRCGGTLADIADAVVWASGGTVSGVPGVGANRANVINLSLGGPGACGTTMQNAINGAVGRGTVVVAAAGNSNALAQNYTPAGCANVIVVATHSHTGSFYGEKEPFSNYGYPTVDLSAPGYQIGSTFNAGTTTPGAANYVYLSGTSMSAPHVSGVVAMMMSKPSVDCLPATCESILKNNVDSFMGPVQYWIGNGRLNARKALDATP